jgi:hypothetical protein
MDMGTTPPGYPSALAVGVAGAQPFDPWKVWTLEDSGAGEGRLVFTARSGVWEAKKTLQWVKPVEDVTKPAAHGYELTMTVELKNTSQAAVTGDLSVHYGRAVDPAHEEKASFFGGVGFLISRASGSGLTTMGARRMRDGPPTSSAT